jgi:hypothetical protein
MADLLLCCRILLGRREPILLIRCSTTVMSSWLRFAIGCCKLKSMLSDTNARHQALEFQVDDWVLLRISAVFGAWVSRQA